MDARGTHLTVCARARHRPFFAPPPCRVFLESLTSIVQTCPPLVSIRETSGCLVPFALHAADACLLLRLQLLVAARYFSAFARQMGERRLRLTLKEQYSVRNLLENLHLRGASFCGLTGHAWALFPWIRIVTSGL